MTEWNPRLPKSWAQILGLVPVPMFGAARAGKLQGTHAIMLDGKSGSFALSLASQNDQIDGDTVNRWSWSSNVRWSVVVSGGGDNAVVRRWDAPAEESKWAVKTARDAIKLFDAFHDSPEVSSQTVVQRGLLTFRDVREVVERFGGGALESALAFNTLLAWVAYQPKNKPQDVDLATACDILHEKLLLGFTSKSFGGRLKKHALGELAQELERGSSNTTGYLLDADLLIRHASGTLYQEAHKELSEPLEVTRQLSFFENLPSGKQRRHSPAPSDIHHTPPSLARVLVEVAVKFMKRPSKGGTISVLDPACGSGVFLIESLRELSRMELAAKLDVRGIDRSDKAVAMAAFCVNHAAFGDPKFSGRFRIENKDSLLASTDWGSPDLIVMNPPFVPWNRMELSERERVKGILGKSYMSRPDTVCAFILRAMESLAPGGALASVVPSTFLESESAEMIRRHLATSGEYQLHLIGQFDYGFFDAMVKPAFVVVSKNNIAIPVRIAIADESHSDETIRALRTADWNDTIEKEGYELYSLDQHRLPPERWTPLPMRVERFTAAATENTFTTVSDFFIPRLGIRVGNKDALILNANEFSTLCTTKREQSYFRPVADKIQKGILLTADYVFYPYDQKGNLLLKTEGDVSRALPKYFASKLQPEKRALMARGSKRNRNWWEVSEPLITWLARYEPRIVSKEFGRAGDFAIDLSGNYAVVQGFGWCWKNGAAKKETLLGYLAILNSEYFSTLLEAYCPMLHGGQFRLRRHFVERVPFPKIEGSEIGNDLALIGRRISEGKDFHKQRQELLTKAAFGVTRSGHPMDFPELDGARIERQFRELADRWEEATGFYSRMDRKLSHPLYRKIVELGPNAIPSLLRDMRDDPGYWSAALAELTGEDPVPEDAETLEEVASAWVIWGKEHGYEL